MTWWRIRYTHETISARSSSRRFAPSIAAAPHLDARAPRRSIVGARARSHRARASNRSRVDASAAATTRRRDDDDAMTVDVDVTTARATRDACDPRRRRWGAAPAIGRDVVTTPADGAHDDDRRAFRNGASAVEDPGECERAASTLWGSSSWFSGDVDASAREANAASVGYGEREADGGAGGAPGGATCQNRFIEGRGARDPFAPASGAGTRLDESRGGRESDGDGWKITRWDTTMVPAGEGRGVDAVGRKPGYRAFAGGEARRLAERPTGATFEFDSARQCWLLIRDGESRELERPSRAMDSPSAVSSGDDECSTDAMDATTVDVDAFAEGGDNEAFDVDDDDEGREMREKTREERIRRYQPSYDECAARFVDRERERRDRFEASRRTLAERRAAPRTTPTKRRSEDVGVDASQQSTWIPLTCDCGVKVWIEASPTIDPSAQLASWVNGDVPWPVVRTLDLGRDRASRGIPRNAPGPVCVDAAALAAVEAELRRRHDENVEHAARSKRPNARAVDPTDPDAVKHASIIDTLVRETTKSSPNDVDASLSIHEQRALRSKLESTIREKHAALAECERLRELLRSAGVEP